MPLYPPVSSTEHSLVLISRHPAYFPFTWWLSCINYRSLILYPIWVQYSINSNTGIFCSDELLWLQWKMLQDISTYKRRMLFWCKVNLFTFNNASIFWWIHTQTYTPAYLHICRPNNNSLFKWYLFHLIFYRNCYWTRNKWKKRESNTSSRVNTINILIRIFQIRF